MACHDVSKLAKIETELLSFYSNFWLIFKNVNVPRDGNEDIRGRTKQRKSYPLTAGLFILFSIIISGSIDRFNRLIQPDFLQHMKNLPALRKDGKMLWKLHLVLCGSLCHFHGDVVDKTHFGKYFYAFWSTGRTTSLLGSLTNHRRNSSVTRPKMFGEKKFDFRRIALFSLGIPPLKAQMTMCSKTFEGHGP